jgi:hypothetical protein
MIFHPSRVKSEVLHTYIEPSFVALALLPACHREDGWLLALLHAQVRSAHQIERRERGVAMKISGCSCPGLTVQPPGALFAVTEEKRALATRGLECHPCMPMQRRIRRAPPHATRLGRVWPLEAPHQAPATLPRLGPPHGSLPRPRRCSGPGAEGRDTRHGLDVDLPVRLPPCPAALRGRPGGAPSASGVAPPCGARRPSEADDCSPIVLLRRAALDTMRGEARRPARSRRPPWRFVAVAPRVCRRRRRGGLPRRRRRDGARHSAPPCHLDHGERGSLQAPCGTTRPAVAAGPEPARLCATRWDAGRVRRRDPCRARGERRPQPVLRQVGPGTRLPTRPGDRAGSVVAVAMQVAAVDATTPPKDRDQPRRQALPLGLPEPGPLLQDIVDHGHTPCTGESGRGIRSPHVTRLWPPLFTPFTQKMSAVLVMRSF